MGLISDVLTDDAAYFVDADLVDSESIVYVKRSGATRTINAVVQRRALEDLKSSASRLLVPSIMITVANSTTTGIATSEVDKGSDAVQIPDRLGGTTRTLSILEIVSQDAGMVTYAVK